MVDMQNERERMCRTAFVGCSMDGWTPQMDVPAVNRSVIWWGSPANFPAAGMKSMPAPTEAKTTGMPVLPVVSSSKKLSLAATQTMPVCKMVLVENVIPLFKTGSELPYPVALLTAMPKRIATGIPEMGTDNAELRLDAI
jgi:hypothetical protein